MAKTTVAKNATVSEFISSMIALSGKSQKEIAEEVGFLPNNVTMIKQGRSKLAYDRIPKFAKALGVDALYLIRLVVREYNPGLEEALRPHMGGAISQEEATILSLIREVSGDMPICPESDTEMEELKTLASKWKKNFDAKLKASENRVTR